jgi:geranyl diphosphate 2-C-methyltransferase
LFDGEKAMSELLVSADPPLMLDDFEAEVRDLYDGKQDDINMALADERSLVHHHFGIGYVSEQDLRSLDQTGIDRRLHELENKQVELALDVMRSLTADHRVFDGGSGRAGTALLIHQASGCSYDGVNISDYQLGFARDLVRSRGLSGKIRFHKANMRRTPFEDASFDWAITNETTMYVLELNQLFREFARILKPPGRYVCMTWAINGSHPAASAFIDPIDRHYLCGMHTDRAYLAAMMANDLVPVHVEDHSAEAVDYWRLRDRSHRRTGVERLFLAGYAAEAVRYMRIVAERRTQHGF